MSIQILPDEFGGSISGRLGKGLGRALSEQVPKEVERLRLSSGLKKLEKETDLDPLQYFTRAITQPGITPQMVESLGHLARQRLQAKALSNPPGAIGRAPSLNLSGQGKTAEGEAPSITTREPLQETIEPYIRPSDEEINQMVDRVYHENPAYFKSDPDSARSFVMNAIANEEARSSALIKKRELQQGVQNTIKSDLSSQHARLGGKMPTEVYDRIENKAINSIKPIEQGGEGLTEQQASKKYGNELNEISKSYNQLLSLGKLNLLAKGAKESSRVLKEIQKSFSDRDEQEIFAKILQTNNGLSTNYAYKLAYPISNTPELDKYLKALPAIPPKGPAIRGVKRLSPEEAYEEVAKRMSKKSGPLAISEVLEDKGYSADEFLQFLEKNKDKYLTGEQARQLTEPRNALPTLNDIFMHTMIE